MLIKENQGGKELLLAMKKRGFGAGKWNGVGGKIDPAKGDKNIIEAAMRETDGVRRDVAKMVQDRRNTL